MRGGNSSELDDHRSAKRVRLHDDSNFPGAPVQRSSSGNSDVSNSADSGQAKAVRSPIIPSKNTTILPFPTGNLRQDYILKDDELGRGQFGVVRSCIHRRSGALLACKTIMKDVLQKQPQVDALKIEIAVLACLAGHPNIVEHVGVYEDQESVHVVMELCRGGDLFDLIKQAKRLREVDAAWLFRKIVGAVGFCHARGLVHRDLKPENILVGMDGSVEPKLADFGLAVALPPGHTLQGLAGSPSYMAPEVIWGEPYGAAVDIWSLGVILYFMLSGFLPFYGANPILTFAAVCHGEVDLTSAPWTSVSSQAKSLIRLLLVRNPAHRPSIDTILNHPWLLSFGPSIPATVKRKAFLIPHLPGHDLPEDPSLKLLHLYSLQLMYPREAEKSAPSSPLPPPSPPSPSPPPPASSAPPPSPSAPPPSSPPLPPPSASSPTPPPDNSNASAPSYASRLTPLDPHDPLAPIPSQPPTQPSCPASSPPPESGTGLSLLGDRSWVSGQHLQCQKQMRSITGPAPHLSTPKSEPRREERAFSISTSNSSGVTHVTQAYYSSYYTTSMLAV